MASKKIEREFARILNQVRRYKNHNQVEELSYMVGAALRALLLMGCPANGLLKQLIVVVDDWTNSPQAPVRS